MLKDHLIARGLAMAVLVLFSISAAGLTGRMAQAQRGAGRNQPPARMAHRAVRVLFIGNSLTGMNDLPAAVQAMASTAGVDLDCQARISGGANLEDHWNGSESRKALTNGKWEYLVLQQGPSSLPESRLNLRQWATIWANEARRVGAKPALYMVWPYQGQKDGFSMVSKSYRDAAVASQSLLLPAGDAWTEALKKHSDTALYQADRLHPTVAGTYLAALVITCRLTGTQARRIPATVQLANGPSIGVAENQVGRLRDSAEIALSRNAEHAGAINSRR